MFFYSFPIFGDNKLTNIVEEKSYKEKENSKLQMKLIKSYEPDLVKIPFFSHIKVKKYNPHTGELTDKQFVSIIKERVRSLIHSARIMSIARRIYYILRKDKKGYRETIEEITERDNLLFKIKNTFIGDIINFETAQLKLEARTVKSLLLYIQMIKEAEK